jgi:hypothetical protein
MHLVFGSRMAERWLAGNFGKPLTLTTASRQTEFDRAAFNVFRIRFSGTATHDDSQPIGAQIP